MGFVKLEDPRTRKLLSHWLDNTRHAQACWAIFGAFIIWKLHMNKKVRNLLRAALMLGAVVLVIEFCKVKFSSVDQGQQLTRTVDGERARLLDEVRQARRETYKALQQLARGKQQWTHDPGFLAASTMKAPAPFTNVTLGCFHKTGTEMLNKLATVLKFQADRFRGPSAAVTLYHAL